MPRVITWRWCRLWFAATLNDYGHVDDLRCGLSDAQATNRCLGAHAGRLAASEETT